VCVNAAFTETDAMQYATYAIEFVQLYFSVSMCLQGLQCTGCCAVTRNRNAGRVVTKLIVTSTKEHKLGVTIANKYHRSQF
jgi:hypothetical protein